MAPSGRYVHGLKVVCPPYPSDQNKLGCVLEVFDFNVHPKRLSENATRSANLTQGVGKGIEAVANHGRVNGLDPGTQSSPSSPSLPSSPPPTRPSTPSSSSTISHEVSYTIHTKPSTVPASDVFIRNVVSNLPYAHIVRKDLCTAYSGFMIDDERIVGLKVSVSFSPDVCSVG